MFADTIVARRLYQRPFVHSFIWPFLLDILNYQDSRAVGLVLWFQ